MERCVRDVKAKGKGKDAYAICYKSVVGSAVGDEANARLKKGGK